VPTPGGLALLQRIELAVGILQGSSSGSLTANPEGAFKIAASEDLASTLLLGSGVAFRRDFPGVLLEIIPTNEASGASAIQLLEEEKVDIAAMHIAPRNEAVEFEPMFLFERVLLVPRGHVLETKQAVQVTWEDIAAFPLILSSPRIPNHRMLEAELSKREIPYRVSLEIHGLHLITKAVALGLGIAVLGNTSVLMEDQAGLTSISLGHLLPRDIGGLAYRRGKSPSKESQGFITAFKQFCALRTGLSAPVFPQAQLNDKQV
jgi:DNA-binding transcriptional LysR family regulator